MKVAGWSAPPVLFLFWWFWATPSLPAPVQITRPEYDAIKSGLTYKEVVAIVGEEGKIDWQNESEAMGHMAQVQWSAGGRSFVLCHFSQGRVSDKTWYDP